MPVIKLQHLVSVSSEDQNHPASNLFKEEEFKKWKCAPGGQTQASVILQFEKASKINSIDIGNEGSAFVEVLVGRMSDDDKNYKVLLVASSFMSPLESRNGTNPNRVRIFGTDKLCPETINDSWDRVRIVCTQPYNKTAQYGLSFIKFHSPAEAQPNSLKKTATLGAFTLKDEKEPTLVPGSLFAQRKETKQISVPQEIRQASLKEEGLILKQKKLPILSKLEETTSSPVKRKNSISSSQPEEKRPKLKETSSLKVANSKKTLQAESKKTISFNKIMAEAVIALSGFVNPLRGDLRDKAVAMGAKYKPDWDDSCTHLICAFANTPKFNQVNALNGKIATKNWILDCYEKKKQISWENYKLGSSSDRKPTNKDNSKDKMQDHEKMKNDKSKVETTRQENVKDEKEDKKAMKDEKVDDDDDDDYGGSTDVDSDQPDRGYDSETELESDEEINSSKNDISEAPALPNYFGGRTFFMYGNFEDEQKRKLLRFIVAFNGKCADYMSERVDYVLTHASWDHHFDEALDLNKNLIFVQPKWIFECAKKGKLIPHQPFIVSASF